ncbi:MAG: AEC family transporter [Clostridiales bacterium]|nr:AEC family transporter [Clostridiales bacterium]
MLWDSISAVLTTFVFLVIGIGIAKAGWIHKDNKKLLSLIVMYISVPCTILINVLDTVTPESIGSIFGYVAVPAIAILVVYFAATVLGKSVLKVKKGRQGVFACCCSCTNILFVGMPIVLSAIGDVAVPYIMYYLMAQNIIFWSLGVMGIQRDGEGDVSFSLLDTVKKVLSLNVVVIFISLALVALRIEVPVFFMDIADKLGSICTPLSLIFCGATMFEVATAHGLKGLRPPKDTFLVMFSRFFVLPVFMFFLCTLLGITGIPRSVFVIVSAMPTQTQTVIMSNRYGGDEEFASLTFFWTTLSCFIVAPVLLMLFG